MNYILSIIRPDESVVRRICSCPEELAELVWAISDSPRCKVLLIEKEEKNEEISQNS